MMMIRSKAKHWGMRHVWTRMHVWMADEFVIETGRNVRSLGLVAEAPAVWIGCRRTHDVSAKSIVLSSTSSLLPNVAH